MYRPEITAEVRAIRVAGAQKCLRNVDQFTTSVVFSDTQNFRYNETGDISLFFGSERESPNTVLVWGCLSSAPPMASSLRIIGKFDSSKYMDILTQHVLPLAHSKLTTGIVHDWYPVHRSRAVTEFLRHKNNISVLDWPKSFGDVMPLESVWLKIQHELKKGNVKAYNADSVWKEVSKMWHKVCTDDFSKKVIEDIPLKLKKIAIDGSTYVD